MKDILFFELSLRVCFGAASKKEKLRFLGEVLASQARLDGYLNLRHRLAEIKRRADEWTKAKKRGRVKLEPMPEHVRQNLLKHLRKINRRRRSDSA
jgi:hypothetical protein